MKKSINNNYSYMTIFEAILVGLFGGLVISCYRLALATSSKIIYPMYSLILGKPIIIIAVFVLLAILGYIVGWCIKLEPMITGSGIPQVEGILLGKMKFCWWKVIILKFIGGLISLGAGLSLGREGPSIQLGAASGIGVGQILKKNKTSQKIMMTYGSSAGLAAAFNAPLAGVLFSLEELHKNFSTVVLVGATISAIIADFISKLFFGTNPVFNIPAHSFSDMKNFWLLLILGLVLGCFGIVFNKVILFGVNKYNKIFKLPVQYKVIPAFLCAGVLGMFYPIVLGGGHELVQSIVENIFTIRFLVVLLIVKFLFTAICYSTSAPGGIFLPLLSIGAIIGCIVAKVFVSIFDMDTSYINTFIVLGMAGYFSAVVKSPITGVVLIAEMQGSFESFLALALVSITAYIVSDILNGEPVYEMLLKNSLKSTGQIEFDSQPIKIVIPIKIDSKLNGMKINELKLHKEVLISKIVRGGQEIIPNGDTIIQGGDYLSITTLECYIKETTEYFD